MKCAPAEWLRRRRSSDLRRNELGRRSLGAVAAASVMNASAEPAVKLLDEARVVFWDFDGVVKESVGVKADAFEQLFLPYGADLAGRVREHHLANTGTSRYEKMPVYLEWVGESSEPKSVQDFCDKFGHLARKGVIEAAWVPGVAEYLEASDRHRRFALVTATPQAEMEDILQALRVQHWFRTVYGAPIAKSLAVEKVLLSWECLPSEALLVGDSESDFHAAKSNGVRFLLRSTPFNSTLRREHRGAWFESL